MQGTNALRRQSPVSSLRPLLDEQRAHSPLLPSTAEIDSSTAIRIALSDVPHSQRACSPQNCRAASVDTLAGSVCGLALLADAVLVRRYSLISPSSCSVVTHSVAELEAAVGLVGVSLVQDLASPTSPSTPPTSETGFNYVETREVACTNANAKVRCMSFLSVRGCQSGSHRASLPRSSLPLLTRLLRSGLSSLPCLLVHLLVAHLVMLTSPRRRPSSLSRPASTAHEDPSTEGASSSSFPLPLRSARSGRSRGRPRRCKAARRRLRDQESGRGGSRCEEAWRSWGKEEGFECWHRVGNGARSESSLLNARVGSPISSTEVVSVSCMRGSCLCTVSSRLLSSALRPTLTSWTCLTFRML